MKPLFEIRRYQDLHAGLRRRAEDLNISRLVIDEIGGLQPGYSSKLLAPDPIKNLGAKTLGGMLRALGLKLIAVEDPEAMQAFEDMREPRRGNIYGKKAA